MDDPVLRGRIIAIAIGVLIAASVGWCFTRKRDDLADQTSETRVRVIEKACAGEHLEPGTPDFKWCVDTANRECGGGGGIARNVATCTRAIANRERPGQLLAPR